MEISYEEAKRRLAHPDNLLRVTEVCEVVEPGGVGDSVEEVRAELPVPACEVNSPLTNHSQSSSNSSISNHSQSSVVEIKNKIEEAIEDSPFSSINMSANALDLDIDILDAVLDQAAEANKRKPGRPAGLKNLPDNVAAAVGTMAAIDGSTVAAEVFDISQPGAHYRGTDDRNKMVKAEVMRNLNRVKELASSVVERSLGQITDERLNKLNAVGLSQVAKNAAGVVEKLQKKEDPDQRGRVVIVAFPQREMKELAPAVEICDPPED